MDMDINLFLSSIEYVFVTAVMGKLVNFIILLESHYSFVKNRASRVRYSFLA